MTSLNGQQKASEPGQPLPISATPPPVTPEVKSAKAKPGQLSKPEKFEHPLMLQQSSIWSRLILWVLMSVTTTAVLWACFAKIEEAIPAPGKLEPQGMVKDVQVPVSGVVKAVYVKDGQQVKPGDLLLSLDPTTAKAQLVSLQQIRTSLLQENQFYKAQLSGTALSVSSTALGRVSPQFLSLTKSRATLVAENQLFQAQLHHSTVGLTAEQLERLHSSQAELDTRATAVQLEAEQLGRQLSQADAKLASAKNTLALNQKILTNVLPLAETGAISQVQLLKQQQEVETSQSEVSQLVQEQARLKAAILQAQTQVQNTLVGDRKDLMTQMAQNNQAISEIDSQLTKASIENNKKLAEIGSQLAQAQQTLKYGDLRSPVVGTVFELKANTPGFVATPTDAVLKIVPDDTLVAKVSITNQDIGFVKTIMCF